MMKRLRDFKRVLQAQRWLPVVVVAGGVAVTFALFQTLQHREQELVQMRFESRAEDYVHAVEQRIEGLFEAVRLVENLYRREARVSPEEFEYYTEPLMARRPWLRFMLWAPRVAHEDRSEFEQAVSRLREEDFDIREQVSAGEWVPADQRDEYFPVTFIYPFNMHRPLWGHDLKVHAAAWEAIEGVCDETGLCATEPILLLSDLGAIRSIWVFATLDDPQPAPNQAQQETAGPGEVRKRGVVAGVFELDRTIETIVSLFDRELTILEIRDEAAGGDGLVYRSHPKQDELFETMPEDVETEPEWILGEAEHVAERKLPFLRATDAEPTEAAAALSPYTARIAVAGRTWHVTAMPTQAYFSERATRLPRVVLVSGLLLTIILGLFLNNVLTRAQRVEEQVAQRTAELRKTAEALRRSNESLEEFAFIASHDLQEPLRKVRGFGEMLESETNGQLSDEQRDHIHRMRNAADRMQALITGLLEYSRVTTQSQPPQPVNLTEVARQVREDLELRIRQSGANVEIDDMPTIEADPIQMRQLFQNLISNALKFHRSGVSPHVQVRAQRLATDRCRIEVEDDGVGFDPNEIERIFKPFQRLHGRGAYDGTGMGLALCKKIAECHGGSITAQSSPGEGSTFIVTLPCSQNARTSYG